MAMLTDPAIRAVVPPWGGETAIHLLPLLDWQAITRRRSGLAGEVLRHLDPDHGHDAAHRGRHGARQQPHAYPLPDARRPADVARHRGPAGASVVNALLARPAPRRGVGRLRGQPAGHRLALDGEGTWVRLDGAGPVDVTGRLIGGRIETLGPNRR